MAREEGQVMEEKSGYRGLLHLFQASSSSLKAFRRACSSGFRPFALRWKALQRSLRDETERWPLA
jgi:hypothetical protein